MCPPAEQATARFDSSATAWLRLAIHGRQPGRVTPERGALPPRTVRSHGPDVAVARGWYARGDRVADQQACPQELVSSVCHVLEPHTSFTAPAGLTDAGGLYRSPCSTPRARQRIHGDLTGGAAGLDGILSLWCGFDRRVRYIRIRSFGNVLGYTAPPRTLIRPMSPPWEIAMLWRRVRRRVRDRCVEAGRSRVWDRPEGHGDQVMIRRPSR